VKAAARRAGIQNLAPHDLRRTCARLCHVALRGVGADPVSTWARFGSDYGALSGLQAGASPSRQRQAWP
jgi:integrase